MLKKEFESSQFAHFFVSEILAAKKSVFRDVLEGLVKTSLRTRIEYYETLGMRLPTMRQQSMRLQCLE